jgi:hypothetical protein
MNSLGRILLHWQDCSFDHFNTRFINIKHEIYLSAYECSKYNFLFDFFNPANRIPDLGYASGQAQR